jgi:hypothetical protein
MPAPLLCVRNLTNLTNLTRPRHMSRNGAGFRGAMVRFCGQVLPRPQENLTTNPRNHAAMARLGGPIVRFVRFVRFPHG